MRCLMCVVTTRRTIFARCAVFTWGTRFAGSAFATLVLRMLDGGFVGDFAAVVGRWCVTFFAWTTLSALATAFAAVTAVAVA